MFTLGGGGIFGSQNSKCQVLAKFSFGGGFLGSQNSKCQVLAKFSLGGGVSQNSKCQVLAKFSFLWGGGGYSLVVQMRIGILGKMSKIFTMPYSGSACIADSLSHTMCVETNNFSHESLKCDLRFCPGQSLLISMGIATLRSVLVKLVIFDRNINLIDLEPGRFFSQTSCIVQRFDFLTHL